MNISPPIYDLQTSLQWHSTQQLNYLGVHNPVNALPEILSS